MICNICKVDQPESDFPKKPTGPYPFMCRSCERNRAAIRKHGITNQQKQRIAQHQCGCAICGHTEPGGRGWVVDHDHDCCPSEKSCAKCRRGVLCVFCNMVLGNAFDRIKTLQSAIKYLEAHADGTCGWHRPVACAPRICGNGEAA